MLESLAELRHSTASKNTESTNHRQNHHGITLQRESETVRGRERQRETERGGGKQKTAREETDLKADPFL